MINSRGNFDHKLKKKKLNLPEKIILLISNKYYS